MERHCAYHPEAPAIAVCTVCDEDICATCHRRTLTGYAVCRSCQEEAERSFRTRWENASSVLELPYAFLHTTVAALSSPRKFFGRQPAIGGWLRPALLGLVAMEIGTIVKSVWEYFFVDRFRDMLTEYADQVGVTVEQAVPLFFVSLPFTVPIVFAAHLVAFHYALRIAGTSTNWRLSTRIVGFASCAFILQIVPPIGEFALGHLLALIWMFNLEIAAVQRYFQLGFWKTMAVVLVPFVVVMIFSV